jgi:predicted Zn-dependent protease
MQNVSAEVLRKLAAFANDELTWAELEGMTPEQAASIAQTACDLAEVGQLDPARILLEGLVATNPRDAGARAALGTVYQKLGRPDEALEEYNGALRWDPKQVVALANRGELRLHRGDAGGGEDLVSAVSADPAGSTAAGKRAQVLVKAIAAFAREAGRAA